MKNNSPNVDNLSFYDFQNKCRFFFYEKNIVPLSEQNRIHSLKILICTVIKTKG